MNSQIVIDFKEPNFLIKNQLNYNNSSSFDGSTLFTLFNQNIEIDYVLENNKISLVSPNNANDIKIDTLIELKPFFLNSKITLNKQNLKNVHLNQMQNSLFPMDIYQV